MRKLVRKIKTLLPSGKSFKKKPSPLMLIPIVLLAAVLTGGYFLFIADDDDDKSASNTSVPPVATTNPSTTTPRIKPDPAAGKEFTIDSDRDEKDYALAQATGSIKTPASIGLRIGVAPKQPVTVHWNIVCLLPDEGAKTTDDTFTVTPPHARKLKLPVNDAVTCTASANAQGTRAGTGRIKVFLLGVRRAGA